jgi:hypothetical protein
MEHLIHPVVEGSDYSILRILDDAFPDERQALADYTAGPSRGVFRWRPES